MERKRNNPQTKGKEEASERKLTEQEASQLSDTEFKAFVIRKLNELKENYQKLQGIYKEVAANYINMKGNRNYQQGPRGNEQYNFGTEEHSGRNQKQTS